MILFKPEHVAPILSGDKTQTRRLGKRRWKVGSYHQCKTRLFGGEPFARVAILHVWQQPLQAITEEDVRAEGYATKQDFLDAFCRISGPMEVANPWVWAVEFVLVKP